MQVELEALRQDVGPTWLQASAQARQLLWLQRQQGGTYMAHPQRPAGLHIHKPTHACHSCHSCPPAPRSRSTSAGAREHRGDGGAARAPGAAPGVCRPVPRLGGRVPGALRLQIEPAEGHVRSECCSRHTRSCAGCRAVPWRGQGQQAWTRRRPACCLPGGAHARPHLSRVLCWHPAMPCALRRPPTASAASTAAGTRPEVATTSSCTTSAGCPAAAARGWWCRRGAAPPDMARTAVLAEQRRCCQVQHPRQAHHPHTLPWSTARLLAQGGMGVVTQRLAAAAMRAGAAIRTGQAVDRWAAATPGLARRVCRAAASPASCPAGSSSACASLSVLATAPLCCHSIIVEGGAARGVVTAGGAERRARHAVCVNADPFRLRQLAGGPAAFPPAFNARLDAMRRDGTTMKARGRGRAPPAV